MVQVPESAEYDGMVSSAIGTGLVDYKLLPGEMPAQLIAYVARAFGRPPRFAIATTPQAENAMKKIFIPNFFRDSEAFNRDMLVLSEQLQSTNERLETSKEEMQSINKELSTVNAELQTKVSDLSRANNDMNNLLAGTGIATIFVDHQLRILRFTPAATGIINLIKSDIGRPVAHIASNLVGYNHLPVDTRAMTSEDASKLKRSPCR